MTISSGTHYAIIVAGGQGTRMKSATPKQFILLSGKPVLMHTIERFAAAVPDVRIIVVLAESLHGEWKELCSKHNFSHPHLLAKGGETRFHSVRNGLGLIDDDGITAVHDGARPLASIRLIQKCFAEASIAGNAVPCMQVQDSLRNTDHGQNKPVDRNSIVAIQTPQCFSTSALKKAYELNYNSGFTDDASVYEASGGKINLIEGEKSNLKITYPEDVIFAEAIIKSIP